MEYLVLIIALIIASGVMVWIVYTLISEISAVAFVPSDLNGLEQVFKQLNLKPGKVFVDVGSGDGRVAALAANKFKLKSVGYEINPWLILFSRWKYKNIEFKQQSLWKADLKAADYIYCYLSPRAVEKLARIIEKQNLKNLTIISKAFEIKSWKNELTQKIEISNNNFFIYNL